jgi:hypothetical protein
MNQEANSAEGIQPLDRNSLWDAVDVHWCDSHKVDGYLAGDFHGEILECGWYYEPLMQLTLSVYSPRERCEGPRGPFTTSEIALAAAINEAFCMNSDGHHLGGTFDNSGE